MKTKKQLQNLREALVWWQTVPLENVAGRLSFWADIRYKNGDIRRDHTDCGTVACFGGWCARHPLLIAQGVSVDSYGCPVMGLNSDSESVARIIFGDRAIFEIRDQHPADEGCAGTDHELVTNRIRWALEHA